MVPIKKTLLIIIAAFCGISLSLLLQFGWATGQPSLAQARQISPLPIPQNRTLTTILPDAQITVSEIVAVGFTRPVGLTHAGDGSGRLFVIEQSGKIRIIQEGIVLNAPFLDLSQKVACCGERGLLGLAFHPNYAANGYFYVNYTRASDGATVIARYSAANPGSNTADSNSGSVLLTNPQPYANHNGGQLQFSPLDGYLYIGMGDGGSGGDPLNNGQDPTTLLGALLRLDVDSDAPYAIPPDNPYIGKTGKDEIWAIGLRNPWRFSFDRQTGDLYLGDVGQNLWEEIDYQAAGTPGGLNFGWRCKEGDHNYNFSGDCSTAVLTDPITEYSHTEGQSVTGGFVYRGLAYPILKGRYFYADYVQGKIWSLYKTGANPDTWSIPELELDADFSISAFGEDEAGELYVLNYTGGEVRRLADVNGPWPDLSSSRKLVSRPSANSLEVVTYTIQISNTGGLADISATLTDTVPAGLSFLPGSLQASHGQVSEANAPQLSWQGNLSSSRQITLTYKVQVDESSTGSLVNTAQLAVPLQGIHELKTALSVPRSVLTSTTQDFLFPGTQPGELHVDISPSADCDICHSAPIYNRWRGSMMSHAGRDPLMWAALYVANIDAPGSGEYCLRCHTAKGWLEGRSKPADGGSLLGEDIRDGVGCAVCHRMVDPQTSTTDEAVTIDQAIRQGLTYSLPAGFVGSSAMIIDPDDNRRGPFSFNQSLPYHSALQTDYFRQSGQAVTRARLCGTCHNVYNPLLSWDDERGQYWLNSMGEPPPAWDGDQLFPIETTFDEWLFSEFASNGVYAPQFAGSLPDGIVRTCQDCHMRRATGPAADPAFNPVWRDCLTTGCLPEHIFAGGNTWVPELLLNPAWRLSAVGDEADLHETVHQAQVMLRRAASLSLDLTDIGTAKLAEVRVTNLSGHKLPSGYPEGRQMWINLKAFDSKDQLIYESGAYDAQVGQLIRDPDIKVYEVVQGISPELAELLPQSAGESFHFVLNNIVIKDNRIPPQGYTQNAYNRPGLQPVGATYLDGQHWDETQYLLPAQTERVLVTLYYQTASKEYIDFLTAQGGVDGLTLGELWQESRSPPQVMAQTWLPEYRMNLPLIAKNALAGAMSSSMLNWINPR